MFEPVKEGFGRFLQSYYRDLVATTPQLREFKNRGFSYSVVLAPSRMVDQIESMVGLWQRNDTNQGATTSPKLPVIIVAFAKDYAPTSRDYSTQITDSIDIIIPDDDKQRYFKLKTIVGDLRVQLAFVAADEPTAKSAVAQFLLYLDNVYRRGFNAPYQFAGFECEFPCQIETPDNPASSVDTGSQNLTLLAVDLNLHCTVPLYESPDIDSAEADGKGSNNITDPSGFKLVESVHVNNKT